jgi:hypothetical protein
MQSVNRSKESPMQISPSISKKRKVNADVLDQVQRGLEKLYISNKENIEPESPFDLLAKERVSTNFDDG